METRRRFLRRGAAGAFGLAGAYLVACGGDSGGGSNSTGSQSNATAAPATPTTASAQATVPAGKPGGTFVLSGSDLQQLDFQKTISTPSQNASSMVFSRLASYDPYSDLNVYAMRPDLAESWEQAGDKIVFKLRQGVKWQNKAPLNGRELVADDIKYSMQRVGSSGAEFVHAYKVEPISSIDTPDKYTVVLNLKQPSAALMSDLASGQGMGTVPREIIEEDGDLNKRWVGTGPYMLDQWQKGSFIRFVKNPDYYKPGLPYLDVVETKFITDASTNLANFLAGQLNFYIATGLEQSDQIKKSTKAEVRTFPNLGGTHKLYNVGSKGPAALRDIRIRQAIDLAIDRDQLLDLVLGGDGVWAATFVPLGFGEWSQSDAEVKQAYAANPAEAKKLVEASGLKDITIPVEYSNIDAFAQDEFPLLKQMLAKAGIELQLKPLERTIYLQNQVDSDFNLMGIGMGSYPDPDNYLFPTFHSKGSKNYGQVSDADLDARIDKQRAILDYKERVAYLKELQKDWKKYLYRTYTVNRNDHHAWQPNTAGRFVPKGWDYQGMEAVSLT
jgi:ABC-type transport system substrate-binding protein